LRAEWSAPESQTPYLVMYSDNYFDLLPGETKTITLEMSLSPKAGKHIEGHLCIEGSNVSPQYLPLTIDGT
jgi:hypothetical protein